MSKILNTLTDDNPKYLVTKIEDTTFGYTIYGRARDSEEAAIKMQELVAFLSPSVRAHSSDLERAHYHPNGPPKKRGEYYFHHVHMETRDPAEKIRDIKAIAFRGWASMELYKKFANYIKGE